jgi:hypothetical protein
MFELAAILGLVVAGLVFFAIIAAVGLVLKLAFKIVLFPVALLFGALKIGGGVALCLIALVLAPAVLTVLAVLAVPLLILCAMVCVGFFVFAIAA